METLGISYKYYQKIERGKANVTLETIEKIASALGRDPVEFFTFPLDKSPEVNQMAALTGEIIQRGDQEADKRLYLFNFRLTLRIYPVCAFFIKNINGAGE